MPQTVAQLHESLKQGKITVRALVDLHLQIIKEKDPSIHALLGLYSTTYIDNQITKAQKMFTDGSATALTGIPVVLKDNILVKGELATGASKILENYIATYDATVVKKLHDAGAVLIGRANMDEFAMGGSTENSAFGVTKNPCDITKVAGGSSGGSAAVVAYGGVPLSLGSDTGGSIRQPASFCGVVGLKTTYGDVSRYGLMAMGSSLDQIGPFGRCVDDVEALYKVISGHDPLDSTSLQENERNALSSKKENKKVIGIPTSFVHHKGVSEEVLTNFNEAIEKIKTAGYTVKEIDIKDLEKSLSVYYVLMPAEVSSNLARYDGIRYGFSHPGESSIRGYFESRTRGFGKEVRRRILLGTYVLSSGYYDAYYNKANLLRSMLEKEFDRVFQDVDYIATPTSPIVAFGIGEKSEDPLAMYLADIFTVPANIVGIPGISVPTGKNKAGLPFGVQFMGPKMSEYSLFTIGRDLEKLY
jgi:aspartyl-tRNA(Asn)/glutamyl-tRNA(Gln) amidotransferase subunit A